MKNPVILPSDGIFTRLILDSSSSWSSFGLSLYQGSPQQVNLTSLIWHVLRRRPFCLIIDYCHSAPRQRLNSASFGGATLWQTTLICALHAAEFAGQQKHKELQTCPLIMLVRMDAADQCSLKTLSIVWMCVWIGVVTVYCSCDELLNIGIRHQMPITGAFPHTHWMQMRISQAKHDNFHLQRGSDFLEWTGDLKGSLMFVRMMMDFCEEQQYRGGCSSGRRPVVSKLEGQWFDSPHVKVSKTHCSHCLASVYECVW